MSIPKKKPIRFGILFSEETSMKLLSMSSATGEPPENLITEGIEIMWKHFNKSQKA